MTGIVAEEDTPQCTIAPHIQRNHSPPSNTQARKNSHSLDNPLPGILRMLKTFMRAYCMLEAQNGDGFTVSIKTSRGSYLPQIAVLASYGAHGLAGFLEGVIFF